jgi:hypothetical protein
LGAAIAEEAEPFPDPHPAMHKPVKRATMTAFLCIIIVSLEKTKLIYSTKLLSVCYDYLVQMNDDECRS